MVKFSSPLARLFRLSSCVVFNENNHKKYILRAGRNITTGWRRDGEGEYGEENVITRKKNCLNYFLRFVLFTFYSFWWSANSYTVYSPYTTAEWEARAKSDIFAFLWNFYYFWEQKLAMAFVKKAHDLLSWRMFCKIHNCIVKVLIILFK